jgi:hypothetical protein
MAKKSATKRTRRAAASQRAQVFAFIHKRGYRGATDDESEVALKIRHESVSARRNGLVRRGSVRDSGLRRLTRRGNPAIVWVVGEGMAIEGAPNRRPPPRPTREEMRLALSQIDPVSKAGIKLCVWLRYLVTE